MLILLKIQLRCLQQKEDMVSSKDNGNFPGEKLIREIQEELTVKIKVGKLIDIIEYDYPKFHLNMKCFLCVIVDGDIILKEAEDSKWMNKDELYGVNWLPADITLIDKIADFMNN